jgi:dipeptidase E
LGLREGSWLEVNDSEVILRGSHSARWFEKDKTPREIETNTKL